VGGTHFRSKKQRKQKKKILKDPSIDYTSTALLDIAHSKKDGYSIGLILEISRAISKLTKEVTKHPMLHPELIASGMAWKTVQHVFFALTEECLTIEDLEYVLRYSTVTLKNLVSFASQWAEKGGESFAFKNLNREKEREILLRFSSSVKHLFGNKMLLTLLQEFEITNNALDFKPYKQFEPSRFLGLFAIQEEKSAELVWNNQTRTELQEVLGRQLTQMGQTIKLIGEAKVFDFFTQIEVFDYDINQTELRVQTIFVRHFNNDPDFRPPDIIAFAQSLDLKL
jgi:hypothetical protein